ncbi:MAG: DUF87 domain-containing protein [Candidatus Omnitrophota bacterium]
MIQIDEQTDELILRLEPAWGREKAEKLKLIHAIGDEERKDRLSKILKLSANKLLNDSLLPDQPMLPPSTKEECGLGEITLGQVCYGRNGDGTDRELYPLKLSMNDLRHHILCTGLTGTGKTTLAYNIAVQLAEKNVPIWIVDWNRTWSSLCKLPKESYPFVKDIRVYTIGRETSPFRYNLFFSPPPGVSPLSWIGIISEKPLSKSLLSGQGSGSLILNEAENLLEGYQQGKLHLLPNIEDIKKRVDNQFLRGRASLWKDSAMRVLSSMLRPNTKELFGSRNPMDISKMLERPGITILEMDIELPNSLRILFQETLLLYIMLYFLSIGETEKLRMLLIMEESQNMMTSSTEERMFGDGTLQNIYREGRKLGLGVVTLAQECSELKNYAFQCKTQIHFAANTFKDVSTVSNGLFLKQHETRYIDYIWLGQAFAKVKGRAKNCLIKTPPPLPTRKLTDEELKELVKKWNEKN